MARPHSTPEKDAARFWRSVDRSGGDDACWPWLLSKKEKGYGQFVVRRGDRQKNYRAHRYAYFLTNGDWPKANACHSCDNPSCCNPSHLWDGDDLANQRDSIAKGRAKKAVGSAASKAKLTEEQVMEIRALAESGVSQASLSRRYGVNRYSISALVHRRTWRHV